MFIASLLFFQILLQSSSIKKFFSCCLFKIALIINYALLEYLMVHQGRPVSQEELMDHVWDNSVDSFSNSIRVHISALRKKLRAALGYEDVYKRQPLPIKAAVRKSCSAKLIASGRG